MCTKLLYLTFASCFIGISCIPSTTQSGLTNNTESCITGIENYKQCQVFEKRIGDQLPNYVKTHQIDIKDMCKNAKAYINCLKNLKFDAKICNFENEKESIDTMINIGGPLEEFVCFNEGERLTSFFSNGGYECVVSKADTFEKCLSEAAKHEEILKLTTKEHCSKADDVRKCFVPELQKCPKTAVANSVDEIMKYVLEKSTCGQFKVTSSKKIS